METQGSLTTTAVDMAEGAAVHGDEACPGLCASMPPSVATGFSCLSAGLGTAVDEATLEAATGTACPTATLAPPFEDGGTAARLMAPLVPEDAGVAFLRNSAKWNTTL